MDVLWFQLSARPGDPEDVALRLVPGRIVAPFPRRTHWQVGYVIPKGADAQVRAAGLEALRRSVAELVPELADRVDELRDWEQVKLLTVRSDRLRVWWREGYLAIGDAAHAMSPIGGVGINLAIQDAVVAANRLWRPLRERSGVSVSQLAAIQRRRELTVRLIQRLQAVIQDQLLGPALGSGEAFRVPIWARLLLATPGLRDLPPRLIAYGLDRPRVARALR